jgi:DNA-binding Lrp family transcriptional regulator
MSEKSFTMDVLDYQLLHALQIDARVPFARFAALVGVSEQTVARRFRRLRSAGVVRVVGMIDPQPLGDASWIVRIQSRPDASIGLADALARRPEIGWVTLTSGGSEIICVIRARTTSQRDELLLRRLPKTAQVLDVRAYSVMHKFDDSALWPLDHRLSAEQAESLLAQAVGGGVRSLSHRDSVSPKGSLQSGADVLELTAEDDVLLAELAVDGRAPISRLAEAVGRPPARVHRRLDELVHAGLLYFDAEMALGAIGFRAMAFVWLTVAASHLHATGTALAEHREAVYVAATTGTTNLIASVVCRDQSHLYQYVTESLGALEGLTGLEISPFLRRIKQGGSMMTGDRLLLA